MTIRERLHRAEHPRAADGRYEPMARAIHAREMLDLDVLLIRHDPESPRWHEQAADAGHAAAMVNRACVWPRKICPQREPGSNRPPRTAVKRRDATSAWSQTTSESTGDPRARRRAKPSRLDDAIETTQ
jgi:hypothetical protein